MDFNLIKRLCPTACEAHMLRQLYCWQPVIICRMLSLLNRRVCVQAKWFRQQRGIARYNCADSLDRTNVGSFFGAVQVRFSMSPNGTESTDNMWQ